ncbi:MAG: MFS transporter [Acidobacteria bacterium]|nr:MFS transporter [Acidobacteriota bacterium]
MFRALRNPNYRLFFAGQGISLVGTWTTRLAASWLVYRLTDSALLLGLVGFFGQIPTLILAPFAGVFIDRWNRRSVLLVTQSLSMMQSLALAALTLSGRITVADVMMLQALQGGVNAFDTPARQAFVVEMVEDRADLANAIALNSSLVNGSRMIGPAVGGALTAAVGEGWCFLADGLSYIAVMGSLLAMTVNRAARRRHSQPVFEAMKHGFEYVAHFPPVRSGLLLVALVSMLGMPYQVLMPVMASEVFGGGPNTLGILMMTTGVGALAGTLYLAWRHTVVGLGTKIAQATLTFGVALVIFASTDRLWVALVILPIAGAGFIIALAATNTVVQTLVPEHLRGRVMAFYTMAFLGTAPIGSLIAGVAAERIGAPRTIMMGGVACAIAGAWFYSSLPTLRDIVHPIYAERGLLVMPDADSGSKTL